MIYKADLHVHSKYSNKPTIWALRKLNCPESFTTPQFIYETALRRGMSFVTISDHNSIDGALEIAHCPEVFTSSEITAFFPEDGGKAHVVVLDINESQFRDIMGLRQNIYELVDYLIENDIVHFIAHPFFDVDGKLNADKIEKMLLLFKVVEVMSGSRSRKFVEPLERIILSLNRDKMERLADKHDLEPRGKLPWVKAMVGGSDDHSGFFIARAYTISRKGANPHEFVSSIGSAEVWPGGEHGDPLTLAHSLYGIAYRFFRNRVESTRKGKPTFLQTVGERFFTLTPKKLSLGSKIRLFLKKSFRSSGGENGGASFEELLDNEAMNLLADRDFMESLNYQDRNRKIFTVTSALANRVLYIYTQRLTKMHSSIGPFEIINSLSAIGLAHLLASPYYIGYLSQHRGKDLLDQVSRRIFGDDLDEERPKIALFTDTLHEINGVAITIKRTIQAARQKGIGFVVITSTNEETGYKDGVMNFKSIGDFALPEYPEMVMSFPPALDLIDYIDREGFNRIHVSTPGTMGLMGLFISKLMDIPISGTYHTDIPQYVRDLTRDATLEEAAWSYMIWFYNMMNEVLVPSSSTKNQLIERGLEACKVKPLPRWVETSDFHPDKRNTGIWKDQGFEHDFIYIYVGRVSKEKNLEMLAEVFKEMVDEGRKAGLVIVGDGPYREEMEEFVKGYPVLFTGYKSGEELSALYASADVFVFPSTTDTFGNVVLESQASGLPVIVSDSGGPRELMIDGETGIVTQSDSPSDLKRTMIMFLENPDKVVEMGRNARRYTEENGVSSEDAYNTILLCGDGNQREERLQERVV